jgi:membrane protease YdiL (CAAX protease family)
MKSALTFFGLTYATSWVLWGLVSLVPPGTPFRTALFLPGTVMPAFVALWLTGRAAGRPGVRGLIDRMFMWRVPARWYLFALLYLAAIKLAAAVAHRVVAGAWPPISEQIPWVLFLLAALTSTPFQAGEEIGWRGYALPRVARELGVGGAAVLLGIIWAAWHLPLFYIPATDLTGQSFPFYLISVIAISVVLAWLYVRTHGSLLLVMLMHAAINNTPHFVPPAPTGNVWALNASLAQWLSVLGLWIGAGYFLLRMPQLEDVPA